MFVYFYDFIRILMINLLSKNQYKEHISSEYHLFIILISLLRYASQRNGMKLSEHHYMRTLYNEISIYVAYKVSLFMC